MAFYQTNLASFTEVPKFLIICYDVFVNNFQNKIFNINVENINRYSELQ